MENFFGKEFPGPPFELFGPGHLIALVIILFLNLSFLVWRKRAGEKTRSWFRYGLAAILLIDEAAWHAWNVSTGQWSIQTTLPLHICSIFVFLSAYMLITRNKAIYPFAYFLGISGALQALLTPDAGVYGFPHFRAFQVMISHGAIITAALYMTLVEEMCPTWKEAVRVFLISNVYMVLVGIINFLIGSNYLFIARKPDTASLLDMLGPWPWYILAIEAIGIIMILILYLPFAIKDYVSRHRIVAVQP
jgi:hypothetical integral membrane protein (TIGR02206 family)